MKTGKKLILSILSVIIVLGAAMLLAGKYLSDYNTALKANWEISIPSKARYSEIYTKDSGPSFLGDGIRYHVFSYKENAYAEEMLDWEADEKESIFHGNYSDTVNAWLDAIEVPAEYRPNCSQCLFWYDSRNDNSEIIILWDAENSTIYVVESFM